MTLFHFGIPPTMFRSKDDKQILDTTKIVGFEWERPIERREKIITKYLRV